MKLSPMILTLLEPVLLDLSLPHMQPCLGVLFRDLEGRCILLQLSQHFFKLDIYLLQYFYNIVPNHLETRCLLLQLGQHFFLYLILLIIHLLQYFYNIVLGHPKTRYILLQVSYKKCYNKKHNFTKLFIFYKTKTT